MGKAALASKRRLRSRRRRRSSNPNDLRVDQAPTSPRRPRSTRGEVEPHQRELRHRTMRLDRLTTSMLLLMLSAAGCGVQRSAETAGGASSSPTCGPDSRTSGFALSLVSDTGGAASPVEAARDFVLGGSVWSSPTTGWTATDRGEDGATVSSGDSYLHVFQGPDMTWQVDSGYRCR